MASRSRAKTTEPPNEATSDRLSSDARREALLDIALELVVAGGPEKVTMGTVAERAKVTRTLVYKHFANRDELLRAVFRREANELDAVIVAEVKAAQGFEQRLRMFVRAVLRAVDTHGPILTPLLAHSQFQRGFRTEPRRRDRRNVRFFAELARTEYDLSSQDATAAISMLLPGIASLWAQAQTMTTASQRKAHEDLFVLLVTGALTHLAAQQR
jgi:AcrR family transcriptional regulator